MTNSSLIRDKDRSFEKNQALQGAFERIASMPAVTCWESSDMGDGYYADYTDFTDAGDPWFRHSK